MRISDWSSDVCSSDLEIGRELIDQARRKSKCDQVGAASLAQVEAGGDRHPASAHLGIGNVAVELAAPFASGQKAVINAVRHRSEERRVGKECVSTCRSRWSP